MSTTADTVRIRRVRACERFNEPTRGLRKFCADCGFAKLLHKKEPKHVTSFVSATDGGVVDGYRYVDVECECGKRKRVYASHLFNGKTTSCGCFAIKKTKSTFTTHGMTKSSEFKIWQQMNSRCHDERNEAYDRYGGRGIRVCDTWRLSFVAFYDDVGPRPSSAHSIDRIDNDRGYETGNVRWATAFEQNRNKRTNRILELDGESMCVTDWSAKTGIDLSLITARIDRLGWSVREALTIKAGESRYRKVWCSQCGDEFGPRDGGYSHCEDHS